MSSASNSAPLVGKLRYSGADADLGELGDLVDGDVDAVGGHQRRGRLEDALAVALRVGAQVPFRAVGVAASGCSLPVVPVLIGRPGGV